MKMLKILMYLHLDLNFKRNYQIQFKYDKGGGIQPPEDSEKVFTLMGVGESTLSTSFLESIRADSHENIR